MKFYLNHEALSAMDKVVSSISTPESTTTICLGARDMGDHVNCMVRSQTKTEQVEYQLSATKPAGWENHPVEFAVKGATFSAILQSILTFKDKVYLEIDGTTRVKVGVDGKAEVPLEVLSTVPEKILSEEVFLNVRLDGKLFGAFLRKGLMSAAKEDAQGRGVNNAILRINADTGEMVGMSTDGVALSKSTMKAVLPEAGNNVKVAEAIKAMSDKLDAFCASTGGARKRDAFDILIPSSAIRHVKAFTEGNDLINMLTDGRHVIIALGNVAAYTFTMGAKAPFDVGALSQFLEQPSQAQVCVDAQAILTGIDFVNRNNALTGREKSPVHCTLKESTISLTSGAGEQIVTNVKLAATDGNQADVYLNGVMLQGAISQLEKGNVLVRFLGKAVIVANGNLKDGVDPSGVTAVMLVAPPAPEEASATEEEDA